jgi:multidrug efflux pump subunit AcrA (membrane-fusion protein)
VEASKIFVNTMIGLRHLSRRAPLPVYAAALSSLAISACAKKQERAPRPVAMVSVVPARRATVPYIIESNGIVTPVQTVSVTPQVDGIIQSVDFQEGQEVRPGQSLFHIDARPYQNAYNQALAVLARDSATWASADVNAKRYKELLAAKVITPLEAEAQFTSAATTNATLQADRAAVEQARFNLDNAIVRAPIPGRTGNVLVKRGNLVRSGAATPLVVINQVRPIYVRFSIPSSELPLVQQYGAAGGLPVAAVPSGVAPATPSIDSLAAAAMNPVGDPPGQDGGGFAGNGGNSGGKSGGRGRHGGGAGTNGGSGPMGSGPGTDGSGANGAGTVGGGGTGSGPGSARQAGNTAQASGALQGGPPVGERLMGKLSFIDNAIDTSTQTVQLKATFDNANGRLWAGQFTATSLHLFDEDGALVVPTQAIVNGQRGTYVYVVDQADTARQRGVVVERQESGLAIIASGIREGDRVVTDGQSRLTPDAPVRIRGASDLGGGGNGAGRGRGGRGRRGGAAGGGGGGGSGGRPSGNGGGGGAGSD